MPRPSFFIGTVIVIKVTASVKPFLYVQWPIYSHRRGDSKYVQSHYHDNILISLDISWLNKLKYIVFGRKNLTVEFQIVFNMSHLFYFNSPCANSGDVQLSNRLANKRYK